MFGLCLSPITRVTGWRIRPCRVRGAYSTVLTTSISYCRHCNCLCPGVRYRLPPPPKLRATSSNRVLNDTDDGVGADADDNTRVCAPRDFKTHRHLSDAGAMTCLPGVLFFYPGLSSSHSHRALSLEATQAPALFSTALRKSRRRGIPRTKPMR